jgi:hypothetical protein
MNKTKKDLPASIHQRLLNLARRENRTLNEVLQHFAIERFLFRLGRTGHRNTLILKGAQMLRVWDAPAARPTMDIDLLGKVENNIENLKNIIRECCSIDADDGVIFDEASIAAEPIRTHTEYEGIRITATGCLGKIKLNLQIDIGFGDAVIPAPVEIEFPALLDLGKPVLLGYTPESTIAEKFQAIVALDMVNTRMKDFHDIWLLLTKLDLDKTSLRSAIHTTFQRRHTELPKQVPIALSHAFVKNETKKRQWQAFLRKNRLNTDLSLSEAADKIRLMLLPLIGGEE